MNKETDELRRMLDERGVEWHESNERGATFWNGQYGIGYYAKSNDDGETLRMLGVNLTPEQAIAATLERPTWRNSYDQQRFNRWHNSLFHGDPSNFNELIEDVVWTTATVDLGPNGNECQGVDEGEVYTERLIESWAKLAATLGAGECELHECEGSFSAVNRPVWRCDCGAFVTQYTDATTYHKPRYCPNCGRKVVE